MRGKSDDMGAGPAATGPYSNVGALGESMRECFESKRWDELRRLLALDSLWLLTRPMTPDEAIAAAADVFDSAEEIELTLLRILSTETSEAECRGTYLCRLGWFEPAITKQHEVSFDLHIGFRTDGEVRLSHLGVTHATPEPEIPSPAPAKSPAGDLSVWLPSGSAALPDAGTDAVTVYVPVSVPASTVSTLLRGSKGESEET